MLGWNILVKNKNWWKKLGKWKRKNEVWNEKENENFEGGKRKFNKLIWK